MLSFLYSNSHSPAVHTCNCLHSAAVYTHACTCTSHALLLLSSTHHINSQTASSPQTRLITSPPAKKIKRVNGYNLFFSDTVRSGPEISTGIIYIYMYTKFKLCKITDCSGCISLPCLLYHARVCYDVGCD